MLFRLALGMSQRIVDLLNLEHNSEEPEAVPVGQRGLEETRRLHLNSRSSVAPIRQIRLVLYPSAFSGCGILCFGNTLRVIDAFLFGQCQG